MTTSILRRLLAGLLFLIAGVVHAEGGCPDGYYPIGAPQGQQGPQGCAPIPGYSQEPIEPQQPSPQWISQWAAIATYAPTGVLGVSINLPSQNSAESAAISDCRSKGGLECKIEAAYTNGCSAVVVGDKGYNVTTKATLNEAIQSGMETCTNEGGVGCHVYYSACSLPIQVQ
jgi:hypothetical protein